MVSLYWGLLPLATRWLGRDLLPRASRATVSPMDLFQSQDMTRTRAGLSGRTCITASRRTSPLFVLARMVLRQLASIVLERSH